MGTIVVARPPILGISRMTLYNKLHKYHQDAPRHPLPALPAMNHGLTFLA